MSPSDATSGSIQSPCVNICVLHSREGICVGCYRSAEEIARWLGYTPEERQAIMQKLPGRAGRLKKRRGGRRGRMTEKSRAPK